MQFFRLIKPSFIIRTILLMLVVMYIINNTNRYNIFYRTIASLTSREDGFPDDEYQYRSYGSLSNTQDPRLFWQFEPSEPARIDKNRTAPPPPTKVVLLWTGFFGNWSQTFHINGGPFTEIKTKAGQARCLFTQNRTYLTTAQALIFHGRNMDVNDLPYRRFSWQRYIFFLLESPMSSSFRKTDDSWPKVVNNIDFNWTMTYSKQSDVYFPYGTIRRSKNRPDVRAVKEKIRGFTQSFHNRPVDAVWIVSNCKASSLRRYYVKKLQKLGITVDMFGHCGKDGLDKEIRKIGEQHFFSRYRYYFAFENAICTDYITEKAFHAFYVNYLAGSIPVVFGGGNYSDFFLEGSYISLQSFSKLINAAALMKKLSEGPSKELESYYYWQKVMNPAYDQGYELETDSDSFQRRYFMRAGWRRLCSVLWDDERPAYVTNIKSRLGNCSLPIIEIQ